MKRYPFFSPLCLQELKDTPVMSYDPLPPADSVDLYDPSSEARRRQRRIDDEGGLALFFR